MPIQHFFLALLVVFVWGINFLFVKLALDEFSPLLLCAVRFILASIPAIFFIKPPALPFKTVASYAIFIFALQFALIFIGMRVGMPPGVASILLQVQVFFSLLFAAVMLGEVPHIWQILGALIAFVGIGLIAMHLDNNVSLAGFLCILGAAASWGIGNLVIKKAHNVNMIALVVWGSFIACFPMIILSLLFEGPSSILYTYHHLTRMGTTSLLYIVYISTWVGYGLWSWLLSRYPVGMVVPVTLLIPIVGMLSSVIFLGEPLQSWKIESGLLVIGGLCINLFGARFFMKRPNR
jgi:O-acetylserine/cysteine efflux transporter